MLWSKLNFISNDNVIDRTFISAQMWQHNMTYYSYAIRREKLSILYLKRTLNIYCKLYKNLSS